MKVGVCIFDEPSLAKAGWASIAGSNSKRIQSVSELSSNVFWVTNIGYFDFKKLNLFQSSNIVEDQFFRVKLATLLYELQSSDDPRSGSEIASKVLNRVHEIGKKTLGIEITGSSYRYSSLIQNNCIDKLHSSKPSGSNPQDISMAILQSTQENQVMSSRLQPRGSRAFPFSFPRGSYAKYLLSLKYPSSNEWKTIVASDGKKVFGVQNGKSLKGSEDILSKLQNHEQNGRGLILRTAVQNMEKSHQSFAQFGMGANKMIRNWATGPEIIEMARYSKVEVNGGYYTNLEEIDLPDEIKLLLGDQFSVSHGIFLENYWVAISSAIYSKNQTNVCAIGAFMRAYDRIACGRAAEVFSRNNFVVGAYSLGRVLVFVRPGEEQTVKNIALELGLIPQPNIMR
ncbi:hypothetical protein AB6D11_02735 [Vibrio splendidus]